jgi:putative NADH-flavin reductase
MVITIFGASGKVGSLVVAEALSRGHQVRAFIHHSNALPDHPNLSIEHGDIHDKEAVEQAIVGSQAVVSALGSWGTPTKDILTVATGNIIPAMHSAGIERIVSLTGSDAHDVHDNPSLSRKLTHALIGLVGRKILNDGEQHIRLLRASELDWTVLRSPIMSNGARIFYKLSLRPVVAWPPIPRRAVAKAILDQLDGAGYRKEAPFIHHY